MCRKAGSVDGVDRSRYPKKAPTIRISGMLPFGGGSFGGQGGDPMGHVRNGHGVYGRLQKRLDRFPIGAPPTPALYEILKRLYTEEEAEIACRMPIRFTGIDGIARRTGKSPDALRPLLARMAEKGLGMDFEEQGKGENTPSPPLP